MSHAALQSFRAPIATFRGIHSPERIKAGNKGKWMISLFDEFSKRRRQNTCFCNTITVKKHFDQITRYLKVPKIPALPSSQTTLASIWHFSQGERIRLSIIFVERNRISTLWVKYFLRCKLPKFSGRSVFVGIKENEVDVMLFTHAPSGSRRNFLSQVSLWFCWK